MDLQELRAKSVKDITPELPALTEDQLLELKVLEEAEPSPRVTLIAAIDGETTSRGEGVGPFDVNKSDSTIEPPVAAPTTEGEPEDEEVAPPAAEIPDWQRPDYTGVLTADKAEWRNRNIKPVTNVATK